CGDVSRRALHGTAAGTRGGAWRAADPRAATAAGRHDDMHERTSMTATADTQRVLETHARQLAETHVLATRGRGERRARVRLPDVAGWLAQSRAALIDPAPELAKAAEWLLDNEYLIARATRQVRDDLTREFEERLPVLGGTLAGQLRVRILADALLVAARL